MKPISRDQIVDFQTYEETRPDFRARVMQAKEARRIHVGKVFTFLFENALTMRYQVQEMMRAERMVKERDIQHEIDTYSGLLGGPGELAATLLIEITDPAERDVKLREWMELPEHLYVKLPDGTKVRPTFDESQRGDGRLSSVQYLKFKVGKDAPVAVGSDLPGAQAEAALDEEQRRALAEDLED